MPNKHRLPPGQTLTSGFPILHNGPIPIFNPATWDFRIWGAVEEPVTWTWDQIMALPRDKRRLDLHCVTTWSKFDTRWEGISPRTLIEHGLIQPKPEAQFVMQHAEHGYSTNLPLAVLLQDNYLIATHYEGQPLTPEHGFPLRGVIGTLPGQSDCKDVYLWKGAKWLRSLEFMTHDRFGFWEANGYHNEADVWKEQRTAAS